MWLIRKERYKYINHWKQVQRKTNSVSSIGSFLLIMRKILLYIILHLNENVK